LAFCNELVIYFNLNTINSITITRHKSRLISLNTWGTSCPTKEKQIYKQKLNFFIKVTGIINSIFKPNLVQKHTRLGVYNVLAKPTLVSWSEAWTITNQDGK
jgi:hypothetical protein